MTFSDWPLVIFSLLVQLATGAFVMLGVIRFSTKEEEKKTSFYRMLNRGWIGVFAVMVIAQIISLTHLGSPINAPLTILKAGSVWLSREVLFALLFTILSGLFALLRWRNIGSKGLRDTVFILGAIAAIVLVFSMSMIYRYVETQPAWHTPWTTVIFFLTAILLGSLAVVTLLSTNYRSASDDPKVQAWWHRRMLKRMSVTALVFMGLDVMVFLLWALGIAHGGAAGQQTVQTMMAGSTTLFSIRIILMLAAALFGSIFLARVLSEKGPERSPAAMAYCALVLVLVAEVISRYFFYAANVRIGI